MKDKYIDQYGNDSLVHLKIASKNSIEYFVTSNKSLLKDRKELEKVFKIKIMTVKEMNEMMKK